MMANHGVSTATTISDPTFEHGFDTYFENLIDLIAQVIPEEIYDTDGSREIGVVAIAAWHHGIAKYAAQHKIAIPPVLLSTLGMLVVLCIIKGLGGKGASSKVVSYFDPGVGFLGDWMALWLVPSLVLFPNALKTVEQPSGGASSVAQMWVKLIVVHFVLWCLSTVGTAKLFELVEKALPPPRNASVVPTAIPSQSTASAATTAAQRTAKQLKVIRFWGVVTASMYAAPALGVWTPTPGSLSPALAGTTITALCWGNAMPAGVKKIFHPLLLAAVASGVAAVLSDRFYGGGGGGGQQSATTNREQCLVATGNDWMDSLHLFTSPSTPPPPSSSSSSSDRALRAGDYFNLLLGPSVVALAFRIFSSAENERVAARMPAVVVASSLSALASLLISPSLGAAAGLPPRLNEALAHRSVSSALAIPSAKATGASPELTVAAVLLTGLYGASGQWLLDLSKVKDEVHTGVTVGTAAHAVGTASLLTSNPPAAAIASVGMVVAGIFHAIVCSVPGVPALMKRLARGTTTGI